MHAEAFRPFVTISVALLLVLAACGPTPSPARAALTAAPSPTPLSLTPPPPATPPATPTATAPPFVPAVMLPTSTATLSPTSLSTLRTVTGRATLESGAPVPGVQVVAQYVEGAARSTEVLAVTDASGSYALRVPTRTDAAALPHMGMILISFVAPPRHVVIGTLGRSGGPPAATASADRDSTGVDVLLAAVPVFLGTISGRATLATSGAPVAGVRIRGVRNVPGPSPLPEATAVTDDRGGYTLNVLTWTQEAPGASDQLTLIVTPPRGLVLLGVTPARMPLVPSASNSVVWSGNPGFANLDLYAGPFDIVLGPGHVVEGRVTSGLTGAPLPGIRVVITARGLGLILGQSHCCPPEASDSTDAAGRYSLSVVAGTYVILARDESGRHYTPGGFSWNHQRFWGDDPAVFEMTPLRVDRDLVGIDVALVPVSKIWGNLSGPSLAEGVEGVRVAAYLAGGTPCCRVVGRATTDRGGGFSMYVPQGLYRIVFDPPAASPYTQQWWRGAADFATATDVTVGQDDILLRVELTRAGPSAR